MVDLQIRYQTFLFQVVEPSANAIYADENKESF
jgi:hypothetical protein